MGAQYLPTTIQKAYVEVRREVSRKKLMMIDNHTTLFVEGTTLYTHNSSQDYKPKKRRSWCDHCKKLGHMKKTCWKIHIKSADWKLSRGRYERENPTNVATINKNIEFSSFTKKNWGVAENVQSSHKHSL